MSDKLEEIRARHAAATPGPWRRFGYQDAIAIEKSWEDVDFLIAEVDRLGAERQALVTAAAAFAEYLDAERIPNYGLALGHKLRGEVLKALRVSETSAA